jgi:hypothetical protein
LASVRFNVGLLDFRTAGLRLRATELLVNKTLAVARKNLLRLMATFSIGLCPTLVCFALLGLIGCLFIANFFALIS